MAGYDLDMDEWELLVPAPTRGSAGQALVKRESSVSQIEKTLKATMLAFLEQQALQSRFGAGEPPKGTVLRWSKSFATSGLEGSMTLRQVEGGKGELYFKTDPAPQFDYLAFRASNGNWYTTSQRGANELTYVALLEEIGDNECFIATDWAEVPLPPKVDESALDPAAWARDMFAKTAEAEGDSSGK